MTAFKNIDDLTADGSPAVTDYVETLKDPSGAPSNRKVLISDLLALGVSGVVDHGGLTGLTDDDHGIYLALDGSTTMTDQAILIAGTAAAPAVTFAGDVDTGLYDAAADTLGFACGGAQVGTWTTAGMLIAASGTLGASALLQLDSTTQGFLPPRMTTAQKGTIGSPATGLVVYDSTLGKLCVYTGAGWETVTSA